MGFLFGRQAANNKPDYTGLQIQTSVNTLPIPIIYGTPRVSVNIIYMNDFTAVPIKSGAGSKSGGKGLLSGGKSGNTQYSYYATLVLAVGEGPLPTGSIVVFQDQGIYNINGLPGGQIPEFFFGTSDQTPYSFIVENHPADARAYNDTAYLASNMWLLDASATVPQFSLLQPGFYQGSCPLNRANFTIANQNAPPSPAEQTVTVDLDMDADPALMIFDFLTNPQYGVLGFTSSVVPGLNGITFSYPQGSVTVDTFIDSSIFSTANATELSVGDSSFQTYCQAVGFGFSIVMDSTEQASSILDRWMKLLATAVVWTGTSLKFIPYWDTPTQANPSFDYGNEQGLQPKYFVPNTTPLFSLDDDDFVQTKDQDPITYERIDTADVYNTVRLDFKDRTNLWNDNVAEAKDENDIELNGIRVDNLSSAAEFSNLLFAANSAQVILQRNTSIRVRYTFKLSWEFSILEPMDVVEITDVKLGLSAFPVRITSIEEDEKLELTITAEEFPIGAATAVMYPKQDPDIGVFNVNVPVNFINVPFIFEPTTQQLMAQGGGNPSIGIGLSASTTAQILNVSALDLGGTVGTGFSGSFTVSTGLYRLIVVGIVGDVGGGNDDITAVTYDSVSMTLAGKSVNVAQNRYSYLYYLVNPTSGSHTVVVSCTNSHVLQVTAGEWTGVRQHNQPDAVTTDVSSGAASTLTTAITTVANGSLIILLEEGYNANHPPVAGAGVTRLAFDGTSGDWGLFESTVINPATVHTMTTTRSTATNRIAHVAVSFAPATPIDPNFGGVDVFVSNDDVTYVPQGRFSGVSTMGRTTVNWPASSSQPDDVNDLFVDLTESDGQLVTVTDAQAQGGASLCAVFNGSELELVAFVTATLTSMNQYQLHTLYRGLYGTEPITAASGSQFLFLGNGHFFEIQLPPQFVGNNIYFKFTAFNTFNSAEQNIADVAVYEYVPGGGGSSGSGSSGYPIYTIQIITTNTNVAL